MPSQHPAQKRYPPELRERAVRMVAEGIEAQRGERFGVVTRVARQLGIGTESLRNWVHQAEIDGGVRPGTTTEDKSPHRGARAREPGAPAGERDLEVGRGAFKGSAQRLGGSTTLR